jgi:hypothetical protein
LRSCVIVKSRRLPRNAIWIPQENPPHGRLKRLYMQRKRSANGMLLFEKQLKGRFGAKAMIHLSRTKIRFEQAGPQKTDPYYFEERYHAEIHPQAPS